MLSLSSVKFRDHDIRHFDLKNDLPVTLATGISPSTLNLRLALLNYKLGWDRMTDERSSEFSAA